MYLTNLRGNCNTARAQTRPRYKTKINVVGVHTTPKSKRSAGAQVSLGGLAILLATQLPSDCLWGVAGACCRRRGIHQRARVHTRQCMNPCPQKDHDTESDSRFGCAEKKAKNGGKVKKKAHGSKVDVVLALQNKSKRASEFRA